MRSISILLPFLLLACPEKESDTSNQEKDEQHSDGFSEDKDSEGNALSLLLFSLSISRGKVKH